MRASRHELRKYSADLGLGLTAQRVHARMTPAIEHNPLDGFLNDLHSSMPAGTKA
jgi:hypothetical protein